MPNYICRICGKDLNNLKWKRYKCAMCTYKERYFGGLYWRVLERDNYTCRLCGKKLEVNKQRQHNVHHINHNPKDNRMDNLELLCINCHKLKRLFKCADCGKDVIALSACQKRCAECGVKNENKMSYRRQAKYWKSRSAKRYMWFLNELSKM